LSFRPCREAEVKEIETNLEVFAVPSSMVRTQGAEAQNDYASSFKKRMTTDASSGGSRTIS
jgi:hypothetical protein